MATINPPLAEPRECSICLDTDLTNPWVQVVYEGGDLPVGHVFHEACIGQWLDRNHNSCPLCRRVVTRLTAELPAAPTVLLPAEPTALLPAEPTVLLPAAPATAEFDIHLGPANSRPFTTRNMISAALLASAATIYGSHLASLAAQASNAAFKAADLKTLSIAQKAIQTILVENVLNHPGRCAIAIATLAFIPQIMKLAKGIGKAVKYCIYNQPIIGASIISAALGGLANQYGPGLVATHLPKIFAQLRPTK